MWCKGSSIEPGYETKLVSQFHSHYCEQSVRCFLSVSWLHIVCCSSSRRNVITADNRPTNSSELHAIFAYTVLRPCFGWSRENGIFALRNAQILESYIYPYGCNNARRHGNSSLHSTFVQANAMFSIFFSPVFCSSNFLEEKSFGFRFIFCPCRRQAEYDFRLRHAYLLGTTCVVW